LLIAGGVAWVAVRGLRGLPDSTGKKTTKGTAIVTLVVALLLAAGAITTPWWIWGWNPSG
jgi:hypothetical protein